MRKASFAFVVLASLGFMFIGGGTASATGCPGGAAAITGLSFSVNGSPASMSGTVINGVTSGATVKASFTIAPGCTAVPLNFSAYNAIAPVANAQNVALQTLRSNASGVFGAGAHSLTIDVPPCFFQIDLYRGPVVTQWNVLSLASFFSGSTLNSPDALRQMLGNATGGSVACGSTGATGTTGATGATGSTGATGTSGQGNVTGGNVTTPGTSGGTGGQGTTSGAVGGNGILPSTSQSQAAIQNLPSTSTVGDSTPLAIFAGFLVAFGAFLLRRPRSHQR